MITTTAALQPGFTPQQYPTAMATPAKTSPAKYSFDGGRDIYIGGSAQMTGARSDEGGGDGLRLAGRDFGQALAAARELSTVPFVHFQNDPVPTSVAVLQTKSGAYMLTTIWHAQFEDHPAQPRDLASLTDLQTRRDDIVAIAGPDGWLQRTGFTPDAA